MTYGAVIPNRREESERTKERSLVASLARDDKKMSFRRSKATEKSKKIALVAVLGRIKKENI